MAEVLQFRPDLSLVTVEDSRRSWVLTCVLLGPDPTLFPVSSAMLSNIQVPQGLGPVQIGDYKRVNNPKYIPPGYMYVSLGNCINIASYNYACQKRQVENDQLKSIQVCLIFITLISIYIRIFTQIFLNFN